MIERLTPQQQTNFNLAELSARKANEAYSAAVSIMPPRSAFGEVVADPTPSFASKATLRAMSLEQQTRAAEVRTAIAAGPLGRYGVTEDDLRVVLANPNKQPTLIHTGNGVDIGNPQEMYDPARSYTSVMSSKNDALFQVAVRGVIYDTRTGMTEGAYAAKVQDARDRVAALPDSKQLAKETGDDWTYTMLTGEPLTARGYVLVRNVADLRVHRRDTGTVDDRRFLRVCPAVAIE